MKAFIASIILLALGSSWVAAAGTTTLTTPSAQLQSGGGTVQLDVTIGYSEKPGALGWVISLPAGWSFDSLVGGVQPAVLPPEGATGDLEFAFIQVPQTGAPFGLRLRYPAGHLHGGSQG
jgi:hypothetical protein